MSEPKKKAVLGLGDGNIDPDILTKEIDHDFFDNPSERVDDDVGCFAACQPEEAERLNFLNKMPNDGDEVMMRETSKPDCGSSSSIKALMRLDKEVSFEEEMNGEGIPSGRSSSNTTTVHLDLRKAGSEGAVGDEGEDFYSIQSNANYPRPKESYQLQQRRRSFGTIQLPQKNGSREQQFQPMNPTDCGLNEPFGDMENTDSSSSSCEDADDESDSDLSDSSESELESLDSDEEFVDMLEKYFDYIDPDSDCSDLTEVSPLSSLAPSPLPPSFFTGLDIHSEEIFHSQLAFPGENFHNMNIVAEAQLIEATSNLHISHGAEGGIISAEVKGNHENSRDLGLTSTAEIDVAVAAVTAVASAVPAAAVLLERDMIRKPKLPMVISTTETVIIPVDEESDTDNNGPGSLCMSGAGTCGTSIDIADLEDVACEPTAAEENTGVFGERDPAKNTKELDVCFNCCVMEHAKKILSREASPSRRSNRWLTPSKQDDEEGNGNNGENGNNSDEIGRTMNGDGIKLRHTWKGKLRTGSSTSVTSSSSSTTGSSSTNTFGSGLSGGSGGGASGGSSRRSAQRNFTFTPEQMRKIERENHVLLRKILDTHQKGYHHGHHGVHCHHHRCKNNGHHHHGHQSRTITSSTSIARLRQQKRIEHENAIQNKKLQNVKPSKDIAEAFAKPVKN